ncbi:hypothetical protein AXF42_Ash008819 [Apostasia shenzhenica]|uniref:Methyltransferase type 11 domain-containing protein n=1 Tax=Apostasia shenzhenica TaxID=1088818 RepID=A0A2I0ASL2_9ASPA|nr:hypothetical protein AXF42_Ash008819 [Apostasia shenzhenica]
MADLYRDLNQTKLYAATRPTYPPELFRFIASKAPGRRLAWDVGTGSGHAAVALSELFDSVVATDSSPEQLSHAPSHLPNLRFVLTPISLSIPDVHRLVAPLGSVDLVTVATALHWLDAPALFAQARAVLRRPGGVLAAWCYGLDSEIDGGRVDEICRSVFTAAWGYIKKEVREMVDEGYGGLEFPFEAVEGVEEGTAPVRRFAAVKEMRAEDVVDLMKTGTGYQRARKAGVELLPEEVVAELKRAWGDDCEELKKVKFPLSLRIGRVGV